MTERPPSATGVLTGLVGLVSGTAALFAVAGLVEPAYVKTLIVAAAGALPMVAVDLFHYRVHRGPSAGLAARPVNAFDWRRIGQKLIAFWSIIGLGALIYWLLPEYGGDYYQPFKDAFLLVFPWLVLLSPLYVAYVDRRQHEPEDSYVTLARLLGGQRPAAWGPLGNFARGWLVKGFFLPLMFVFLSGNMQNVWDGARAPIFEGFGSVYEFCYDLFFLWDVLLAAVGYVLTLRLLDGHIRSAEPSVLGWVACLACYPPFWNGLGAPYLTYERDDLTWGSFFSSMPILYVIWGSVILGLIGVYVWATVMFGTRFSNLTHRGIITAGPYRWVKHPAYLCKNLTWWMIAVPFLTTSDWTLAVQSSLLLLGVNGIYLLRAITEERHLARDPVYRAYQAYIAGHGLFARVRRLMAGRPGERAGRPA